MHPFLNFCQKITHNNPIRKMNHFLQIHSVCTCARNMYILALAGCAPKETCEIALKMRECCQQSCKLCCKMTKMMAFNLDDYFSLCPFHVPSGIPVEFDIVLCSSRIPNNFSGMLSTKLQTFLQDYIDDGLWSWWLLVSMFFSCTKNNSIEISSEIQNKV